MLSCYKYNILQYIDARTFHVPGPDVPWYGPSTHNYYWHFVGLVALSSNSSTNTRRSSGATNNHTYLCISNTGSTTATHRQHRRVHYHWVRGLSWNHKMPSLYTYVTYLSSIVYTHSITFYCCVSCLRCFFLMSISCYEKSSFKSPVFGQTLSVDLDVRCTTWPEISCVFEKVFELCSFVFMCLYLILFCSCIFCMFKVCQYPINTVTLKHADCDLGG